MKVRFLKHFGLFAAGAMLSFTLGCGQKDQSETPAPHTGNPVFEEEVVPGASVDPEIPSVYRTFDAEKFYYVYTNRLNVRSSAEVREDNLVGALGLNDQVRVVKVVDGTVFVQIQVVKSAATLQPADAYYVSKDYLSEKENKERAEAPRSRYFMIQNIATEKMRVYEKMCDDGRCAHKMILEADVAVGEKNKDRDTWTVLGSFNISKWVKFYQDGGGKYPSWYDPNYPSAPKPGSSVAAWTSKKVLPYKGAKVRGAFGWYTAHVGPNPYNQWTHGTLGWGVDKDKYIKVTRGFWANLFADPRSHGCTRTDNETIAYVRHLIETGAPIIKIYAVEKLADESRSRYPNKSLAWQYILTKNGVRVDGQRPDREQVLTSGTPKDQWLEEGTYMADTYPDVEQFKSGSGGARSGKNGNYYGLKDGEMRGAFLIDEGRLVNYAHPVSLVVGGYGRDSFPPFVVAKDGVLP